MPAVLFVLMVISAIGFALAFMMRTETVMQQIVQYLGMGFSGLSFCVLISAVAIVHAVEKPRS